MPNRAESHLAEDRVTNRVIRLIGRAPLKQSLIKPIGPDDDLRAAGLSSLGLVSLMLATETEFGVKIPERDMTPANFRSIARIATLVQALIAKDATSA